MLTKLKASILAFVYMDLEAKARAHTRFQHALYNKFFGKPPSFDLVKLHLKNKWNDIGYILISDLPNGYLLLHCDSNDILQKILFDGPWVVNEIILQLAPWQSFF